MQVYTKHKQIYACLHCSLSDVVTHGYRIVIPYLDIPMTKGITGYIFLVKSPRRNPYLPKYLQGGVRTILKAADACSSVIVPPSGSIPKFVSEADFRLQLFLCPQHRPRPTLKQPSSMSRQFGRTTRYDGGSAMKERDSLCDSANGILPLH